MKEVEYEYWASGSLGCILNLNGQNRHGSDRKRVLEMEREPGSLEGKCAVWWNGDHPGEGFF